MRVSFLSEPRRIVILLTLKTGRISLYYGCKGKGLKNEKQNHQGIFQADHHHALHGRLHGRDLVPSD